MSRLEARPPFDSSSSKLERSTLMYDPLKDPHFDPGYKKLISERKQQLFDPLSHTKLTDEHWRVYERMTSNERANRSKALRGMHSRRPELTYRVWDLQPKEKKYYPNPVGGAGGFDVCPFRQRRALVPHQEVLPCDSPSAPRSIVTGVTHPRFSRSLRFRMERDPQDTPSRGDNDSASLALRNSVAPSEQDAGGSPRHMRSGRSFMRSFSRSARSRSSHAGSVRTSAEGPFPNLSRKSSARSSLPFPASPGGSVRSSGAFSAGHSLRGSRKEAPERTLETGPSFVRAAGVPPAGNLNTHADEMGDHTTLADVGHLASAPESPNGQPNGQLVKALSRQLSKSKSIIADITYDYKAPANVDV